VTEEFGTDEVGGVLVDLPMQASVLRLCLTAAVQAEVSLAVRGASCAWDGRSLWKTSIVRPDLETGQARSNQLDTAVRRAIELGVACLFQRKDLSAINLPSPCGSRPTPEGVRFDEVDDPGDETLSRVCPHTNAN